MQNRQSRTTRHLAYQLVSEKGCVGENFYLIYSTI
jgi:hypothetical protein